MRESIAQLLIGNGFAKETAEAHAQTYACSFFQETARYLEDGNIICHIKLPRRDVPIEKVEALIARRERERATHDVSQVSTKIQEGPEASAPLPDPIKKDWQAWVTAGEEDVFASPLHHHR